MSPDTHSTISDLLADLARQGIQLSASDDFANLRVRGPLTDDLRQRIAAHKQDILRIIRRRSQEQKRLDLPPLVPDPGNRHQPFPLTDIQQAYWIGRSQAFDLGDVSIHFYAEFDCPAADIARLETAWQRMIARHDMLRAVIHPDGTQQILAEVPPYRIEVDDLRDSAPDQVDAHLAAVRARLSHQVFAAEHWPTFELRATLLPGGSTRVHVSQDLLHVDGSSLQQLHEQLVELYVDPDKELPPIEVSYRDYVLAEIALQETEVYRQALAYWKQRVTDLPPAPELPLVRDPGAVQSTRFSHRAGRLDADTWRRLQERCTALGVTPSALLMAANAEVLSAWSRSQRLTLNVTMFNRLPLHPQVDQIIGDFTSLILLGIDQAAAPTFAGRVERLQEQLWSDLEYRHVSGIRVLRELAQARRASSASMPYVFTSLLSLASQGHEPLLTTWRPLGECVYHQTQTPQVVFDNQVIEDQGALAFFWDAVDELFPPGLLDDMFAAYGELLGRLAREDAPWHQPSPRLVAPPRAQMALRARSNDTATPIPDHTLPDLFAAQARRQPDHPALIANALPGARTMTYGELWRRANRLSHRLAGLGARRDGLVAVVMDKGWEQVVAVLGVHAAGAAYLPIDADSPDERLRYLLDNGQVSIVITQPAVEARHAWPDGITRVHVDAADDAGWRADAPESLAPAALPAPGDLAYVLYTSGSTGLPKGVMIEHRSVVNRILDVNQRFGVGPADRALGLTALHHDLSVYDLFGVLAAGATLVVPDAAGRRDPLHWADLMARDGVTFWSSVPAFLEMLVDALEHEPARAPCLASLRAVILAGDWIPVSLPGRLRALGGAEGLRFIASGGPTETTVWDIWYEVGAVDPAWPSIPYGKPMSNTRYHVLDALLQPCPVWVPGELYIAGAGVGRGYWRDEARTRERFVVHPETGERLYRSGDMGRWLPDGNIEFLGREDLQIKIDGQRIELGEIEATLAQHPAVHSAVAVVAQGEGKRRHLVAHVVAEDRAAMSEASAASGASDTSAAPGSAPNEALLADDDVITDPVERVEFKLRRLGVRPPAPERVAVDLGRPAVDAHTSARYAARRSHRAFLAEVLPRERLGRLLGSLLALEADGLAKYRYPSAGGLYPVQAVLHVKPGRVGGVEGGTYYHHPETHRLVRIADAADLGRDIHAPVNRPIFDDAAFTVFLVARMSAIEPMYGRLARDFCLIEAGYMGQLLMTEATACGIGLCPLGFVDEDRIRPLLGMEDGDFVVHSLAGGPVAEAALRSLSSASGDASGPRGSLDEVLRAYLRDKLPPHMVPAAIVLHEALPLTANGKVDRKALAERAIEPARPASADYAPPRNEVERVLAEIVQDVLDLERVSIDENFFELGAGSRQVVQIFSRLRKALDVDIRVTEAFRHPTISALAARISQTGEGEQAVDKGKARASARLAARGRRQRD